EPLVGGVDHERVLPLPGLLQRGEQRAGALVEGRHALVHLPYPVREPGPLAPGLVAHLLAALAGDDLAVAGAPPRGRVLRVVRLARPGPEGVGRLGHLGVLVRAPVPGRGRRGAVDAAVAQPQEPRLALVPVRALDVVDGPFRVVVRRVAVLPPLLAVE